MTVHVWSGQRALAAAALVVAVTLTGCSDDGGVSGAPEETSTPSAQDSTPTSTDSSATETSAPAESLPSDTASPDGADSSAKVVVDAGRTGLGEVGSGDVVSIQSKNQGDLWEVEVFTPNGVKHEVDVSGDGSAVVSGPARARQDAQGAAKFRARLDQATLDFEEAAQAIVSVVAGQITEMDLDDESGLVVWEADVMDSSGVRHEVAIDAATGDVVKNEIDS